MCVFSNKKKFTPQDIIQAAKEQDLNLKWILSYWKK